MADKATIVDVQMPPAADTPTEYYNPVTQGNTPEGRAVANHEARQKRTLEQSWTDAVNNSVAAKMIRNAQQRVDENAPALTQVGKSILAITGQAGRWGESTWDKSANFDSLTKDLPREYWEDVMEQDTLEGAKITRANIDDELRRLQRMGLDKGAAAIVSMAGSLADIDAPLVLASGGLVGAAKVSGKAAWLAGRAGLRTTTAARVGGFAAGVSGGAQAGAIIGVGETLNSDVSTWVDGVMITLTGAALGGTIGGIAPETMVPLNELRKNTLQRIQEGDPYFFDPEEVRLTDEVPASKVVDLSKPVVIEQPVVIKGGEKTVTIKGDTAYRVTPRNEEYADLPFVARPAKTIQNADGTFTEVMPTYRTTGTSGEFTQADGKAFSALQQEVYDAGYEWLDARPENMGIDSSGKGFVLDGAIIKRTDTPGPLRVVQIMQERGIDKRAAYAALQREDGVPTIKNVVTADVDDFDIPEFNPNANAQSLSAAFAGPTPSAFPALKDPVGNMSEMTKKIINASRNYIWSTGFDVKIKAALEDSWTKVANNRIFRTGTGDVTKLWESKSSVLNRMAAAVFEIPSGAVRGEVSNAAILKHAYEKRIMSHLDGVPGLMNEWARDHGHAWIKVPGTNRVVGTRRAGQQEFYRQVMLDMNAVAMGRQRNADPRVRGAADAYGAAGMESLDIMRGRANEIPLAGAEKLAPQSHFMPYRANGAKMAKLLQDGAIPDRKVLYDAYKQSYLDAGTFSDPVLAGHVAKAYVDRFLARGTQLDDSMLGLFSQDGREFLEQSLKSLGLSENAIKGFMRKFDQDAADRGKISSLKNRNDLDLSTPIGNTGLVIADMMRNDFDMVVSTYARQVAGNSALARHGITSRSNRQEWIDAAMAEQRALGEEVIDPQVIDAMFSEFDGGPQVGYDRISGQNRGIGVVSEVKSLTSLALLTFNGFAQLAETGVGIVSIGVKNWYNRGINRMVSQAIKDGNKNVLEELGHFMGAIGQDHNTLRMHLNLDEAAEYSVGDSTTKAFFVRGRELLNQANYIQGYTSLVNHVRGWQQEVAVLGMLDKISRMVKSGDMQPFQLGGRIQRDTGLDPDHFSRLEQLVNDGTIVFRTERTVLGDITYVDRLNMHLWDEDLAQDFASALGRAESQIVQQALAGETSRWMHTQWGSAVTHLQTFPLLAIQKQFFRNAMSRDGQTVALALAAYGTAYMALALRDQLTGTDRDAIERAKTAFGYSNITGWMPMYSDPVMSVLGLEDFRVNSFGPYARPVSVPMVDTMNNLYRASGAAVRATQGEDDWTDRQALRSVPFFRLVEAGVRVGSFGNVELLNNPQANRFAREATQSPKPPSFNDKLKELQQQTQPVAEQPDQVPVN
jgi:hypothetical protein